MIRDNTKYAYAVGRIRALEDRMVDKSKLIRMIDAPRFEDAFSVLNETAYEDLFSGLKEAFDLEELLHLELKRVKYVLDRLARRDAFIEALWLRYDVHNIKGLIKSKFQAGEGPEHLYFGHGILDLTELRSFVLEGIGVLPKDIKLEISRVMALFEKDKDPELMEAELDKFYFKKLMEAAKKSGSSLFKRLAASMIDLANIKTALRAKQRKLEKKTLENMLAPGGSTGTDKLAALSDKTLEEIMSGFAFSPYRDVVSKGVSSFAESGSFIMLEKLMEDHIIKILKAAKRQGFGAEPLAAYLIAKESELRSLRMILASKLNNVRIDLIKERAAETYV